MHLLSTIWLAVPTTGAATPPGGDKLMTIISWLLAIAGIACVAGVVVAGVKIAFGGHGRGGGEHGMALLLSLLGAVVCSAAFLLVSAMGL